MSKGQLLSITQTQQHFTCFLSVGNAIAQLELVSECLCTESNENTFSLNLV